MSQTVLNNRLLSSDDVRGAEIFDVSASRIGTIDHLMIDRETGQTVYAIVRFSVQNRREGACPVPWRALRYSHAHDGFLTKIDEAALKAAPRLEGGTSFGDRDWELRVFRHYGVKPY